MSVIPSIIKLLNAKRISQIDHFKKFPYKIQEEILTKLLKVAAGTEVGQNYDFASISSIKEFQSRIPV